MEKDCWRRSTTRAAEHEVLEHDLCPFDHDGELRRPTCSFGVENMRERDKLRAPASDIHPTVIHSQHLAVAGDFGCDMVGVRDRLGSRRVVAESAECELRPTDTLVHLRSRELECRAVAELEARCCQDPELASEL